MALEKILGTNSVKDNLMIAGRNFNVLESGAGVEVHNIDATAHNDIRTQINNLVTSGTEYPIEPKANQIFYKINE
jgi:hypothetical protein